MDVVQTGWVPIGGAVDPSFAQVRAVFEENFSARGEVGAAVCIYKDGAKVVDLWGGHRDAARTLPWESDTLACMMSVSKAITAIAVLMLVDRGRIDIEAPVARYWPGFARAGKEAITVRQILSSLGGLIYVDHAPKGALFDWEVMIDAIERQAPVWPPGTQGAYHSITQGYLLGELVRRVDGRRIEVFVREEIASPLGVEFIMGLTPAQMARVTDIIPNEGSATRRAIADPTTKLGRAWRPQPEVSGLLTNSPEWRCAVFPSGNGHSNARSIARIFAVLAEGGRLDGVRLLSEPIIEQARTPQWDGICGLTDRDYRYGLGFFINKPPLVPFGRNPRAFGHPGAGGAVGFADPEARLAFSYSPNFMCDGAGLGERCEALIAAAYA